MVIKCFKFCFILCCIHLALAYEYQLTFGPNNNIGRIISKWLRICSSSNRTGNYEIYVIPSTGGNAINLTNNPASDETPCWSPDGSQIAFTSNRSGNYQIWIMNSNGSNQHQLYSSSSQDSDAWSPDGTKIAYSSEGTGGSENNWLCVIPATGGTPLQLVNDSDNNYHPTWSPDSTKVGYMFDPFWMYATIYTVPAGGGTPTPITDAQNNCYSPDWSNDGQYFAFTSDRPPSNSYDIWMVNSNGTNYQRITSKPGDEDFPAWSPDGTKIAYIYDDYVNFRIWVTDLSQMKVAPTSLGQIKAVYK